MPDMQIYELYEIILIFAYLETIFTAMTYIKILAKMAAALALVAVTAGCDWIFPDRGCKVDEESRKVLLLYSAGHNSLRSYLLDDIKDLRQGWLPGNGCNDDILLVYTHTSSKNGSYSQPSTPYLIRLYRDKEGTAVSDTLVTYEAGTVSSSALQINNVLTYIKENYTSGSYGMIFSSHATGYLPAGFYKDPGSYTFAAEGMMKSHGTGRSGGRFGIPSPVPYIEPEHDPSLPMVKSIGEDRVGSGSSQISYEMDLPDFAEAIPMKLDYLLFDACLMGGIEAAYELSGKVGKLGFSQAEVLAEGLDYKTLTARLLQNETPDPESVCDDYFAQYDSESGVYRSATISLIDCDRLEPLAEICRRLFSTYREAIASADHSAVQRFFRYDKHWFYDLESILTEAGISSGDLKELHSALDQCVIYKGHTPEFMNEFDIHTFSGFSMYLPSNGHPELEKFYKTLKWNKATGLVK